MKIGARYEIRINEVPRSYRDVLAIAIGCAQFLKMRNVKDEVKLLDMESRRLAMIVDDVREVIWRDPIWEASANAKPLA